MVYRYRVATVFGGTGFIGRHLIRRLARTGVVIRVPSRHPGSATFLRTTGAVGQIVPIATDIHDDASVAAAVQGSDLVINLIGILAPSGRHTFDAVHAQAAGRIARAAKAAGAGRFVQMSALGADPDSPSAYARSKAEGERLVRDAFPTATIFRPSIVFGPEDGFFNRSTPASEGRIYELGGPRTYSFRELIDLVKREVGRPKKRVMNIPWGLAKLQGAVFEKLPGKLITRDQVELLKADNVLSGKLPGLADLGVSPTAVEVIVPTYLDTYRVGGRFNAPTANNPAKATGPQQS